ncbi:MAG: isoprenylcysteine carboxylmethyltransferase family protein [Anaerolineae bacterium]|nr:isoprenylcysteine carboxylmethyltransferase family protein [Anaerolineae bacterium]
MSALTRSALMVIIGSAIFVGLPILGWGIADISGFVEHPARVGYILMTILLQIIVVLKFPNVGRTGGKGTKLVRQQQIAVLLLQIISLAMVIVVPATDHHDIAIIRPDAVRYLGLLIYPLGFLIMNWSEYSLGKQFSVQVTIQEGHQLITNGPYRMLRHPRYLGIILMNLGLALTFAAWVGLGIVAVLMGVLLWRIHDEEILMQQEFGAEWDAYAKTSWQLIPYLY